MVKVVGVESPEAFLAVTEIVYSFPGARPVIMAKLDETPLSITVKPVTGLVFVSLTEYVYEVAPVLPDQRMFTPLGLADGVLNADDGRETGFVNASMGTEDSLKLLGPMAVTMRRCGIPAVNPEKVTMPFATVGVTGSPLIV